MERDITQRLEQLEKAVARIETLLEARMLPECERMGSHIAFVEGVYDKLRRPLAALQSWGSKTSDLPLPPTNDATSRSSSSTPSFGPVIEEID